jgi:hypothetical protein
MNFCRTEVYAGTPLAQRLRRAGRLLGDLWGYDYVIADPRAQAAFAIIYRAFEPRNYHEDGLHHLTMQVDFEHQLLAHFFGTEPRLRRRVKQFIVTVNHDSCAWLRAIVAALRDGVPGPAERARLVARLTSAIAAANASLGQVGHALVDDIRDLGRRRTRQRAWARGAAAAGLAASLTLLPAACKDGTHPTETIPAPPIEPADAGTTHPTEMVAPPPASASAVAPAASGASAPTGTSDAGATGPPAVGTTHPREAAPRPTTHMHERVPPRPRTPHHPTEMVPFAPQLKTPEK